MQSTACIIALVTALASTDAAASCCDSGRSARVAYGDLDLATAEGVAEFDRRVSNAARKVCRDPRDGESVLVRRACVRGTIAAARRSKVHEIARQAAKHRAAAQAHLVVRAHE